MSNLNEQMNELVKFIEKGIAFGDRDHCSLCNNAANHFNLWENDRFPLWLSRVVEGILRDSE